MYIQPTELLAAVTEAKSLGKCTDRLALHLVAIAEGLSFHRWFRIWSFRDELAQLGAVHLCAIWDYAQLSPGIDGKMLFNYYTKCCQSAFMKYIDKERAQQEIVDELLLEEGLDPTYGYEERQGMNTRWARHRTHLKEQIKKDHAKNKLKSMRKEKIPGGSWRPARPEAIVFDLLPEHLELTEKEIIKLAHDQCNEQNLIPAKIIYKSGEITLQSADFDESLRVKRSKAK